MKAQPLPDNTPERRQRRARDENAARWAVTKQIAEATHERREAEIAAMRPENRIAARLADNAELTAWADVSDLLPGTDAELEVALKDPRFRERLERARSDGRRARTLHLLAVEDREAGVTGPAPTGRMSVPMTRKAIHALVLARYPKHPKNRPEWWKRYIVKPGIVANEEHARAIVIDLGQLLASLHKLTEADIAPWLAAK